jgi:hypothetical protein
MPIEQPTKLFLAFLQKNPTIRMQIRAAPGKTLLYAGAFFKPVWRELAELKRSNPQVADKEILPEVLARIFLTGQQFPNLLQWAQDLDRLPSWKENGFLAWRALSGIFASNAVGGVSFYVASGISKDEKVFAATEIGVLARNPNVDAVTKDVLAYYKRCVESKQANINFGFISA